MSRSGAVITAMFAPGRHPSTSTRHGALIQRAGRAQERPSRVLCSTLRRSSRGRPGRGRQPRGGAMTYSRRAVTRRSAVRRRGASDNVPHARGLEWRRSPGRRSRVLRGAGPDPFEAGLVPCRSGGPTVSRFTGRDPDRALAERARRFAPRAFTHTATTGLADADAPAAASDAAVAGRDHARPARPEPFAVAVATFPPRR